MITAISNSPNRGATTFGLTTRYKCPSKVAEDFLTKTGSDTFDAFKKESRFICQLKPEEEIDSLLETLSKFQNRRVQTLFKSLIPDDADPKIVLLSGALNNPKYEKFSHFTTPDGHALKIDDSLIIAAEPEENGTRVVSLITKDDDNYDLFSNVKKHADSLLGLLEWARRGIK